MTTGHQQSEPRPDPKPASTGDGDREDAARTVPPLLRPTAAALLIAIATSLAYVTSFGGTYVFDDARHIADNEQIRSLSNLPQMLATRRPVVTVSLAINYAISGLDTWSYHAVNILIHIAAAIALMGVLRQALRRVPRFAESPAASQAVALSIALLWAVHPLQTQSVTYLIQRGESMMGLFYMLCVYCVLRGARDESPARWYVAAILCSLLAIGSKAVAITLPAVVFAVDRTLLSGSTIKTIQQRWWVYLGLVATWGLIAASGLAQSVLSSTPHMTNVGFGQPSADAIGYFRTQFAVVLWYLRLSLWPAPLCLDYGWPIAKQWSDVAGPLLVHLAVIALIVWGWIRRKPLALLGVWFYVILLPTSSVVPIRDLAFEHRMYLPLAAVVAVVVFGIDALLHSARRINDKKGAQGVIAFAVLLALPLGIVTASRNLDYHSKEAMWRDILRARPNNPRAHLGVAGFHLEREELEQAVHHYERAVALSPNYSTAWYGLCQTQLERESHAEAARACMKSLDLNPAHPDRFETLARALTGAGRPADVIPWIRRGLEVNGESPALLFELGSALNDVGQTETARRAFNRALQLDPAHAESLVNLANLDRAAGRDEKALALYRRALEADPKNVPALLNVAAILAGRGAYDDAIGVLQNATELAPKFVTAWELLGDVYSAAGDADRAANAYQQVLSLDPTRADIRARLAPRN